MLAIWAGEWDSLGEVGRGMGREWDLIFFEYFFFLGKRRGEEWKRGWVHLDVFLAGWRDGEGYWEVRDGGGGFG